MKRQMDGVRVGGCGGGVSVINLGARHVGLCAATQKLEKDTCPSTDGAYNL